jgi:hypothetical protein
MKKNTKNIIQKLFVYILKKSIDLIVDILYKYAF